MRLLRWFKRPSRATPPSGRRAERLELHVSHACNLTCESCSHYSNHNHRGNLDPAEADRWMAHWSPRIAVDRFGLLGGEPTLNPALAEFVPLVRRHWPHARLRITTNGFFLDRHPHLPQALARAGNTQIVLSLHHDSPDYLARIAPARELLAAWQREFGIDVEIQPSHTYWTRRYHGFGSAMMPFADGDRRRSWEICPARYCKQLHDGRLWKCGPLAYLGLQHQRYALAEAWRPYLAYQALEPGCPDAELDAFLAREDEAACEMCPAQRQTFAPAVPMGRAAATAPL